MDGKYRT
jgi:hypothetical protein